MWNFTTGFIVVQIRPSQFSKPIYRMGRPYDSPSASIHRHDLRSSGQRVRWFPYIPAGPPDMDNKCTAHKLIALGHWNDDVEVLLGGGYHGPTQAWGDRSERYKQRQVHDHEKALGPCR